MKSEAAAIESALGLRNRTPLAHNLSGLLWVRACGLGMQDAHWSHCDFFVPLSCSAKMEHTPNIYLEQQENDQTFLHYNRFCVLEK
jgi:hypothetical protein